MGLASPTHDPSCTSSVPRARDVTATTLFRSLLICLKGILGPWVKTRIWGSLTFVSEFLYKYGDTNIVVNVTSATTFLGSTDKCLLHQAGVAPCNEAEIFLPLRVCTVLDLLGTPILRSTLFAHDSGCEWTPGSSRGSGSLPSIIPLSVPDPLPVLSHTSSVSQSRTFYSARDL